MAALPRGSKTILGVSSTMEKLLLCCCLLVLHLYTNDALPEDPSVTYDILYTAGIEAYMEERWYECSGFMVKALEDYKFYHETLTGCRLKCSIETSGSIDADASSEFKFYDLAIRKSNCIRRCKAARLKDRPEVEASQSIKDDFEEIKPYDYLQICAFKSEQYERAASAAYTYLMRHPEHEPMQGNVAYYRGMPQVKPSYFRDLEGKVHIELYQQGIDAYANEDWQETIKYVEEALRRYYQAAERCYASCEGKYDHESLPDFYNAIADHAIHILRCYQNCPKKLATYMNYTIEDYVPEHYNYLQFAYFKLNNLQKAIETVETFLMFKPEHTTMLKNKLYYKGMNGVQKVYFVVRQDAKKYYDKQRQIEKMLEYVEKEYRFSDADMDLEGKDIVEEPDIQDPTLFKTTPVIQEFPAPEFLPRDENYKSRMEELEAQGMKVVLEDDQLQGEHRVVGDGLLTDEECETLMQLTEIGAIQGDGYKGQEGKSSPHTDYEQFKGLTVLKAAELASKGVISREWAETYLATSQRALDFANAYFNIKTPLFFDFTHLACRTALSVDQSKRKDLSHPVHSDNCHIRADGTCPRVPPAYVHRDFSALLYLNDDFDGGDFFFAHNNKSVQQKVKPKCGRVAAFTSGDYHGVEAVTRGKRCALAMWYTLNPAMQETNHAEAKTILRMMDKSNINLANKKLKSLVAERDIDMVATEIELNGPERFAADNVISQAECNALVQLANKGGSQGDGYQVKGRPSPHTDYEKFIGLTVGKAAEIGGLQGDGYRNMLGRTSSPHTNHEMFEGLTLVRAAELASEQKVTVNEVKLYLNASERGRHIVETYFDMKTPLYFDFTHLVCRTALDSNNRDRTDLSHPIHADNCVLQPDNSCKRVPPAYIDRDYSAILYLNDEFSGGEFFFAHTNMSLQSSLKPKCGRLVGFNSGNYHGVKAVLSGQRCAVAMWFTLDPKYKEEAHETAQQILKSFKPKPLGPPLHGEL